VAHAARPAAHRVRAADPVTTLQRTAGNRATVQLLQREPTNASRLAKAARQLGFGIEERDVHKALRVQVGKDDGVRPGLNIVNNLGTRGRTGYVDAGGLYHGDFLTATRDGELPGVAIMLGPAPFQEGDDAVLTTLRHELVHAEHDRMLLGWLTKWRGTGHGPFEAWMRRQKVSPVDLALVRAGTAGAVANTELLAYIEGFALAFDKTPPPTARAVRRLPTAIEELRGAAQHGWTGADDVVRKAAEDRVAAFYTGLDGNRQDLLRDWLFYLHYHATTPWPKDAKDDEAKAAEIVWSSFQPNLRFLEWMLAIVGGIQFAKHAVPDPPTKAAATEITRPKPVRTVPIGRGKVRAYTDVHFTFGVSHSHGISLGYEGPDAPEMRWLQFIWREVVPDQGRPISGTLYHQGQGYPLTTDPSEPSQVGWNTDTATYISGPRSAFYELDNAANRTAGKLEMFDEPSPPSPSDVQKAFAAQPPGGGVTAHAHLVQYLVKGMKVLFRAEFEVEYRFTKPGEEPPAKPRLVSAQPATAIDPGPRARLHAQFRDLDYLP
jgi:hypothetical protein